MLEPWQRAGLDTMLSVREDGQWASFEYGEICARQNGKTAEFLARALAGMFLLDEQVVLWSAHEVKTAMRSWRDLRRLIRTLGEQVSDTLIDVDGIPVKVNASNGSEGFERLDTGQEIKVVARSKGSGRGFSTDCMIVDEAFAYEEIHQDALMPTLAARPNPQICYASSPPLNGATGAPMYGLRRRALAGGDETLGWRDWGLDIELDELMAMPVERRQEILDDRARWAATNPAFGLGRVSEESILRLRRSLSDVGFAREILGCWPTEATEAGGVFLRKVWDALADPRSRIVSRCVFGVDVNPEHTWGAIAAGGRNADRRAHLEVVDHRPGIDWVVPRCVELNAHSPVGFVLDPAGPAGPLIQPLRDAGLPVLEVTGREWVHACGAFFDAVHADPPDLVHLGDRVLDEAVAVTRKREVGDGAFAFGRKNSEANIAPMCAATLAHSRVGATYDVLESVF